MKHYIILLILLLLVACTEKAEVKEQVTGDSVISVPDGKSLPSNTVEVKMDGVFRPISLNIKAGTRVVFLNKDDRPWWPASDLHPSHTNYPGSDIKKCGTSEEKSILDACRAVQPEHYYEFVFNEVGVWYIHDHIKPEKRMTIIVE